jgi:hypothetical protein
MSIKSSRARDTALVSRGPFTRLDIWTDYSALIICMQEICCASVVLINYLPDFIRTELRCHTMCAAMEWKWLEGKFDKHQDFYLNIDIHYFMPILADASANVSGQLLCLYYLSFHVCCPYAIWLSLYLNGQYYFLEATASLGVNSMYIL